MTIVTIDTSVTHVTEHTSANTCKWGFLWCGDIWQWRYIWWHLSLHVNLVTQWVHLMTWWVDLVTLVTAVTSDLLTQRVHMVTILLICRATVYILWHLSQWVPVTLCTSGKSVDTFGDTFHCRCIWWHYKYIWWQCRWHWSLQLHKWHRYIYGDTCQFWWHCGYIWWHLSLWLWVDLVTGLGTPA